MSASERPQAQSGGTNKAEQGERRARLGRQAVKRSRCLRDLGGKEDNNGGKNAHLDIPRSKNRSTGDEQQA